MSSNVNINYNDFTNICRICMFNCDLKFTLNNVVLNVFYKLTDIHFETNDELPQQICLNCFEKINEIHEFALKCNQTHSSLMNCLNNYKNKRLKQEHDETNEIIKIKEEITNEHKIEFVEIKELYSTNLKIKQEIKQETNNENIIPEISEINKDKNINCPEDDLFNPNTSNIKVTNEKKSNDLNDLNEVTNSISSTNIDSTKNNKVIKQYKCEVCNKTFNHATSFNRHKNLHSGDGPYKCKECTKSFARSNHLKDHMRTHSGERPYECEQCSKSFILSNHLKEHMRTHNGDRPYKCDECSKSFTQSNHLKQHKLTHSGERPFKCKQCSKSFTRSNILISHLRLHSGERPYKCEQCTKSFTSSNNLTTHMRTHSTTDSSHAHT